MNRRIRVRGAGTTSCINKRKARTNAPGLVIYTEPAEHAASGAVAYYRVSTDKQGRSGLGLEAQRQAVRDRLDGGSWQLVGEYTQVESGRRARRPELEEALAACKKHKAKLVVAKLDRLSRNTRFLLTLIESGVDGLFADLPEVRGAMGKFILTQMTAIAELEAGLAGERTKAALAAAKQRGVRLGVTGTERAKRYKAEAMARAVEKIHRPACLSAGCPSTSPFRTKGPLDAFECCEIPRQGIEPLPACSKDRVRHGRGNGRNTGFADACGRGTRAYDMHLDGRHIRNP